MCGIAGIFRRRDRDESDPARLQAMTDVLVHRGPDDVGYLLLDSRDGSFRTGQTVSEPHPCDVCLGNRRLSIIDLTPNGRQPLRNERADLFVVCNGEIFNYLELRDELAARGHVFRSHTDTEVIVHAYEEWGEDCVTRFNGMWAFALWDQRERRLFCSRDRFGIKPFYYHLDDNLFLFASEIKGLLPALGARPRANYAVLGDYLLRQALCHAPETFFEGIRRLEPAHHLTVTAEGARASRYWDYRTRSQTYDDRRPVETFRALLDDAVRLRLRSDVPVGLALSGGLDSTSVLACVARRTGGHPIKAFTAVFPGERFDESEYARLASSELGAELHCVEYRPEHFIEDLRDITWHLDYPTTDSQVLPRWQIMRAASRAVKVILEGQGADEMLAGYLGRYFGPYLLDELGRLKAGRRLARLKKLIGSCRDTWRSQGRSLGGGLWRYGVARARSAWTGMSASHCVYTREFLDLHSNHPPAPWARQFEDRLTNLMHFDHAVNYLPFLLKLGDALSMAFSLESRLPYLDHRLVEFVFQLPVEYKMDGALSKGILRSAMAGAIPERIRNRRDKVGFYTPISQWITRCMDSDIRPLLLSARCRDRGLFDMKKMEQVLSRQHRGRSRMEYYIFQWLSVELWFRLFIDGDGTP